MPHSLTNSRDKHQLDFVAISLTCNREELRKLSLRHSEMKIDNMTNAFEFCGELKAILTKMFVKIYARVESNMAFAVRKFSLKRARSDLDSFTWPSRIGSKSTVHDVLALKNYQRTEILRVSTII